MAQARSSSSYRSSYRETWCYKAGKRTAWGVSGARDSWQSAPGETSDRGPLGRRCDGSPILQDVITQSLGRCPTSEIMTAGQASDPAVVGISAASARVARGAPFAVSRYGHSSYHTTSY